MLGELGRAVAALLCVVLSTISLLALMAFSTGGVAIFGLFATFSAVLALVAVGSPSRGPGLTVRGLRAVIAATCGLATFVGLTLGFTSAIGPALSAFVLAALDPSLGAISLALGGGASDA